MFLSVALYISLIIFTFGLMLKTAKWFTFRIESQPESYSTGRRISLAFHGFLTLFTFRRFFAVIKTLVWDILLQGRLLKAGFLRWFAHLLMVVGFTLLVLMHALDNHTMRAFFSDYEPTLYPYLFLRNLFGAMVIIGIGLTIIRKHWTRHYEVKSNSRDKIAIFLLAMILLSGFLLESLQIASSRIFDDMIYEYADPEDTQAVDALKVYWAKEFNVVFTDPVNLKLLATGKELHMENCAACHSKPSAAFVSNSLSIFMHSSIKYLNAANADLWLWYVHVLSCCLGLAYLPFSKFFHIISVPINLLVNAGNAFPPHPANISTKLALGMDACTHCGVCSSHCSVLPAFRVIQNSHILPSEKLASIKDIFAGKKIDGKQLQAIAEGSFICTDCYRCKTLCPSGIDLYQLWQAANEQLRQKGYPNVYDQVIQYSASQWSDRLKNVTPGFSTNTHDHHNHSLLSDNLETFADCVQCTTCSNVCPVVAVSDNPSQNFDITPQQVMNLLRMKQKNLVLGSKMVWNCTTCYMCQEHCPQGVKITDILYELRNLANARIKQVAI